MLRHMNPSMSLYHSDALKWLSEKTTLVGCSIVTSLPDISEFSTKTLDEWKQWFCNAAALVMSKCPDDGVTIFYQTDIKHKGAWVDKAYLCQKAAEGVNHELIAHKIICRAPPGQVTFGRPAYSHLLCFSKSIRPDLKISIADVLPSTGVTTWTRGMGAEACRLACKFILNHTSSHTIVDPFCGHGSVLAIANQLGLNAVGVDHSLKRIKKAQALTGLKNL